MANFPALKTGVVAQYPSDRTRHFSTQVLRFLDGTEQRFHGYRAPLRRWTIRLDLLDEAELKGLESFFLDQQGQFGSFEFVDPKDNASYPDCSLLIDDLDFSVNGERRGKTTMVVRENRS